MKRLDIERANKFYYLAFLYYTGQLPKGLEKKVPKTIAWLKAHHKH